MTLLTNGHRRLKRLEQVEKAIAVMPLDRRVLATALEHFLETGELPANERYAKAVVDRTLSDWTERQWEGFEPILRVMAELRAAGQLDPGPPIPLEPRDRLLYETLNDDPAVQDAARQAVRLLVAAGKDLKDKALLGDLEVDDGPEGTQVLASLKPGGQNLVPQRRRKGQATGVEMPSRAEGA